MTSDNAEGQFWEFTVKLIKKAKSSYIIKKYYNKDKKLNQTYDYYYLNLR